MAFQLESDLIDEYYRKMNWRGTITYNFSCSVLSIWHFHNGIVDLYRVKNYLQNVSRKTVERKT